MSDSEGSISVEQRGHILVDRAESTGKIQWLHANDGQTAGGGLYAA